MPSNVKKLHLLVREFNQEIPSTVKELFLGSRLKKFNIIPSSVTHLKLGYGFKELIIIPTTVITLTLYSKLDTIPTSVKHLILNYDLTQDYIIPPHIISVSIRKTNQQLIISKLLSWELLIIVILKCP